MTKYVRINLINMDYKEIYYINSCGNAIIDFDKLKQFLDENLSNDKEMERFCSNIYVIAKGLASNVSEIGWTNSDKFMKFLASNIKSNYFVDELIKIINNKDSSYINRYAQDALVVINSDYAVDMAIKNNLFSEFVWTNLEYINDLYVSKIQNEKVSTYLINMLQECDHTSQNIIIQGLKLVIDKQSVRQQLNKIFNHILKYSENYYKSYPADNLPGTILKLLTPYQESNEVKELFDMALSSDNYKFKLLASKLLDGSYSKLPLMLRYIDIEMISDCINTYNVDIFLHLYKEKYGIHDEIMELCMKSITKEQINIIKQDVNVKFVEQRNEASGHKYGITPMGYRDETWQSYYKYVLYLSSIGRYTSSKDIFDQIIAIFNDIRNSIHCTDYDKKAINYLMYDMGRNKHFPIENNETCNFIFNRHMKHVFNGYQQYISLKILSIIKIYNESSDLLLKKCCAYELCNYIYTDYLWMNREYLQHKDKCLDIIKKEIDVKINC